MPEIKHLDQSIKLQLKHYWENFLKHSMLLKNGQPAVQVDSTFALKKSAQILEVAIMNVDSLHSDKAPLN